MRLFPLADERRGCLSLTRQGEREGKRHSQSVRKTLTCPRRHPRQDGFRTCGARPRRVRGLRHVVVLPSRFSDTTPGHRKPAPKKSRTRRVKPKAGSSRSEYWRSRLPKAEQRSEPSRHKLGETFQLPRRSGDVVPGRPESRRLRGAGRETETSWGRQMRTSWETGWKAVFGRA
ncbi:hypothetical protein BCR34DRAFT_40815 [Clohesyomyces aquaticus]|uniref:Uncharacterized protein n=1 Tax=Clohesyomyces aquaticus TaxID=1231657 RepID=A0A1Y2A4W2_9PLEO|nr:hypothetical protein BCR34DRAFT_40815 [Clohesyomyces aquaticus]